MHEHAAFHLLPYIGGFDCFFLRCHSHFVLFVLPHSIFFKLLHKVFPVPCVAKSLSCFPGYDLSLIIGKNESEVEGETDDSSVLRVKS